MRILTTILASTLGAGATGLAGGVLALSSAQAKLPAIMAWHMKPEPHLDGKLVLVCTGELPSRENLNTGTPDPTQIMRAALEAEHGVAVVLIDLRLPANASEKARRRAVHLAEHTPADFSRHFTEASYEPQVTRDAHQGSRP